MSWLDHSELFAENLGLRPRGTWWQKALAMIGACLIFLLFWAVIAFIGTL